MIRSVARDADGKPVVLLGLEAQNMDRLRDGQPVRVNLRRLVPGGPPTDLPDIDVVVFYAGRAEIEMLERAAGCTGG